MKEEGAPLYLTHLPLILHCRLADLLDFSWTHRPTQESCRGPLRIRMINSTTNSESNAQQGLKAMYIMLSCSEPVSEKPLDLKNERRHRSKVSVAHPSTPSEVPAHRDPSFQLLCFCGLWNFGDHDHNCHCAWVHGNPVKYEVTERLGAGAAC